MGKVRKLKRKGDAEILGYVMHEGEVINGKFYKPGHFKVLQGLKGEVYPIRPSVLVAGYEIDDETLAELKTANGNKIGW